MRVLSPPWGVLLASGPDERPLWCLPHAGGSAGAYRALGSRLADLTLTYAIQYPGRQNRLAEPPLDRVDRLAGAIVDALQPALSGSVLLGHSYGALVAFEVARLLQGAGRPVAGLVVSAHRAPTRPAEDRRRVPASDDEIVAELLVLGATDTMLLEEPELRDVVMPGLRADYQAAAGYRWVEGPHLTCPVLTLCGTRDPLVGPEEMTEWDQVTSGPTTGVTLPSDHFFWDDQDRAGEQALRWWWSTTFPHEKFLGPPWSGDPSTA